MAKTELQHPDGKKAVSMDTDKYNMLADAIIGMLTRGNELSHNELLSGVKDILSQNKTAFSGSVNWHFEWVKLDLEARGKIKRITSSQTMYVLNKENL